jgi:hypothetical protein
VILKSRLWRHFNVLKDVFTSAYGEGVKDNPLIEEYYWNGKKANIFMEFNEITKDCFISITSDKMQEEIEADEKASASKAAEGL